MSDIVERLERISEVARRVATAGDRVQEALGLPFRPALFQDIREDMDECDAARSAILNLRKERDGLRSLLKEAGEALDLVIAWAPSPILSEHTSSLEFAQAVARAIRQRLSGQQSRKSLIG